MTTERAVRDDLRSQEHGRSDPGEIDLDHVGVAVHDAAAVLDVLTEKLGGTVLLGQRMPGFEYALVRLGDAKYGMNLEVLAPWHGAEDDFLVRFLEQHSEGPHHLTFVMDNVAATLDQLAEEDISPVRVNLSWAPWRDGFILPCDGHGTVIQVADSSIGYPPMAEMLAASADDSELPVPCLEHGAEPRWWTGRVPADASVRLERVVLSTRRLSGATRFFGDMLGGRATDHGPGWQEFRWPKGARMLIAEADVDGIQHLEVSGADGAFTLGGTRFTVRSGA